MLSELEHAVAKGDDPEAQHQAVTAWFRAQVAPELAGIGIELIDIKPDISALGHYYPTVVLKYGDVVFEDRGVQDFTSAALNSLTRDKVWVDTVAVVKELRNRCGGDIFYSDVYRNLKPIAGEKACRHLLYSLACSWLKAQGVWVHS